MVESYDYKSVLNDDEKKDVEEKTKKLKDGLEKDKKLRTSIKNYLSSICGQDDVKKEIFLDVILSGAKTVSSIARSHKFTITEVQKLAYDLEESNWVIVTDREIGTPGHGGKNKIHPTYLGIQILWSIFDKRDFLEKEGIFTKRVYALLIENSNHILLSYTVSINKWTFPGQFYHPTGKVSGQIFSELARKILKTKTKEKTINKCQEVGITFAPPPVCCFSEMDTSYNGELYPFCTSDKVTQDEIQKFKYAKKWSHLKRTTDQPFSYDDILKCEDISEKPKCYVIAKKLMQTKVGNSDVEDVLKDVMGLKKDDLISFYKINPQFDIDFTDKKNQKKLSEIEEKFKIKKSEYPAQWVENAPNMEACKMAMEEWGEYWFRKSWTISQIQKLWNTD